MNQPRIKSYRDLEVWRRSKAFVVEIYRVTREFPRHERFGLSDQMQRAAVSIPSNIAEGHIKGSDKAFAFHLNVALGSAAELDTQLEIALEVGYLQSEKYQALAAELQEIMKMLRGLLKVVSRSSR
jgi:four helix bundle protein